MPKATEKVKLRVQTNQETNFVPTVPPTVDGVNYYYLYTGGNDGDDGDIEWPVGHPLATVKIKLVTGNYTVNTVIITPVGGSTVSNFSWEIVNPHAVVITDTNEVAESIKYTIMVNVPGGTVGCDPGIRNT